MTDENKEDVSAENDKETEALKRDAGKVKNKLQQALDFFRKYFPGKQKTKASEQENKPRRRSPLQVKAHKVLGLALGAVAVIAVLTMVLWLFDSELTQRLWSLGWFRAAMFVTVLFAGLCLWWRVVLLTLTLFMLAVTMFLLTPPEQFRVLEDMKERIYRNYSAPEPVQNRRESREGFVVHDENSVAEESGDVEPTESSEQEPRSITLHVHMPDPQPPQYLYLPDSHPSDEGDEEKESEECDESGDCRVNVESEEQTATPEVRRSLPSQPVRDWSREPFSTRTVPLESREVDVISREVPVK